MSGPLLAVIVIVVVAVVIAAAAMIIVRRARRQRGDASPPVDAAPAPSRAEPAPMTDLESALASVTDRSGKPMRDRIDAETTHVDELRVPDDTGPLLRRALDSVSGARDSESPAEGESGKVSGDVPGEPDQGA